MTRTSKKLTLGVREISWTVRETGPRQIAPVTSPTAAVEYLRQTIPQDGREWAIALLLDTRRNVIGHYMVSVGTLDSSLVHPREVFGQALRMMAAGLVLAHNHPSGDATPSLQDVSLLGRLEQSAQLLGVELCDFVILGNGFWSAREQQFLKN
jgi:DNA repair protein RadC